MVAITLRVATESVLAELRPGFTADGCNLTILDVSDATVRIGLEFMSEACQECVLPAATISAILGKAIEARYPALVDVIVDDPRA